jgi:hypothetical protein
MQKKPLPADLAGAMGLSPVHRRRALQLGTGWTLLGWGLASLPALSATTQELAAPLPPELQEALPAAQALGAARLRFLGMEIYQARLWAGAGFKATSWAQSPFALELTYARSLSGRLIAERSLKEMRLQGPIHEAREQTWLQAMVRAFPDVKAGDRITGLHTPGVGARFWFNGQSRPAVNDLEFSRIFFGIWLSGASSEPQMRRDLLGGKAP